VAALSFSLQCSVRAPLEQVHAFLCDLNNYVELHPLIESIEEIEARPELPSAACYRVVDRISVGPLRFRSVYTAALEAVSPSEVRGYAWQSPGVQLVTRYLLQPEGRDQESTLLREECELRAPWGLRRFVVGQAERAHAETLQRLKSLLEASA